ncbi:methyltransferase [Nocardiopsis sp. N85]|uniref:methyltransferase n=1 Tax=Nocardiopsis sp. N85 TaxID=3029400 RepID=UPI00237F811B|nr:methyltransferase [Nocardiopsis sp. N85]MDE3721840.1 methyltransferase [Nocardiopsis sp. N85]
MTRPSPDPRPHTALGRMLFGGMVAHLVGGAVRLGLPDALGDRESTAIGLARTLDARADTVERLLRALAAVDLVEETAPGRYALTPTGRLLRSDHPESMAAIARFYTDPLLLDSWRELAGSVRDGSVAFDRVHGESFFDHLRGRPEQAAMFHAAMADGTRGTARVLPDAYDFAPFTTVVDVGGGDGTLLSAILARHPHLRGVVFDNADGTVRAPATLERAGVADRCAVVTGDFFSTVPAGDVLLLKSIVHDWDDDRAVRILTRCRKAIAEDGRLLLVEPMLPDGAATVENTVPFLSDLNMMVNTGGRERTRADFEALCSRADLTVTSVRTLAPPSGYALIEIAPR